MSVLSFKETLGPFREFLTTQKAVVFCEKPESETGTLFFAISRYSDHQSLMFKVQSQWKEKKPSKAFSGTHIEKNSIFNDD